MGHNKPYWLSSILIAIIVLSIPLNPAYAVSYSFVGLTNTSGVNTAAGVSQLSVAVTSFSSSQVDFTFTNTGSAAMSITDIYFDDGSLLALAAVIDGAGVDFEPGATPPNLPGGNLASPAFVTTAGFSADSEPPAQTNGVNPGENVKIRFTLQSGKTFANVLADLYTGALRIGIHVQAFANEGSESFLHTSPVLPSGVCITNADCNDSNMCTLDTCISNSCSNTPVTAGTSCGSSSDTACDNPDTCNGAGVCQSNNEANGSNCGDAGTECTNQDACMSGLCQDNGFKDAGTTCGDGSDTECTDPDTCNGAGSCQANNTVDGSNCGDAGGACINQDTCLTGACQDNGFKPSTTVCDSSAGACDPAGYCSGLDATCNDQSDNICTSRTQGFFGNPNGVALLAANFNLFPGPDYLKVGGSASGTDRCVKLTSAGAADIFLPTIGTAGRINTLAGCYVNPLAKASIGGGVLVGQVLTLKADVVLSNNNIFPPGYAGLKVCDVTSPFYQQTVASLLTTAELKLQGLGSASYSAVNTAVTKANEALDGTNTGYLGYC